MPCSNCGDIKHNKKTCTKPAKTELQKQQDKWRKSKTLCHNCGEKREGFDAECYDCGAVLCSDCAVTPCSDCDQYACIYTCEANWSCDCSDDEGDDQGRRTDGEPGVCESCSKALPSEDKWETGYACEVCNKYHACDGCAIGWTKEQRKYCKEHEPADSDSDAESCDTHTPATAEEIADFEKLCEEMDRNRDILRLQQEMARLKAMQAENERLLALILGAAKASL